MTKAFWGLAMAAMFGWAQSPAPARHLEGVVVDSDGKPVSGVQIFHLEKRFHWPTTGADGTFVIDTSVPAIVFRKSGFRSQRVRLTETALLKVILQHDERHFPNCKPNQRTVTIEGWSARLHFPVIDGLKVGRQARDVDYGFRNYGLSGSQNEQKISHGSGPMWSMGLPSDNLVWQSVRYEETLYSTEGKSEAEVLLLIKDSRGQLPDGTFWRTIVRMGETANYAGVTEVTAKLLDKVLDSACER